MRLWEGINHTMIRTLLITLAHFLKQCDDEREVIILWFALLRSFRRFFEIMRLWEGSNQTMIRYVAKFKAHFSKLCEYERKLVMLWFDLSQFYDPKYGDLEKFCGTMIRLCPITIQIKACISDFLRLWFVDARQCVEIVRPKSLVQTVLFWCGRGYPQKKNCRTILRPPQLGKRSIVWINVWVWSDKRTFWSEMPDQRSFWSRRSDRR